MRTENYISGQRINIYSRTLKKLPARSELRLSDAYEVKSDALECVATAINLNSDQNCELLGKCKTLNEYMIFVKLVRDKQQGGATPDAAVDSAVNECIARGILEDILRTDEAGVRSLLLAEFNDKLYIEEIETESQARGEKIGQERGEKIGEKRGQERGEKIGEKRGQESTLRATVISMLQNGIDRELISKISGFSAEKIAELAATIG